MGEGTETPGRVEAGPFLCSSHEGQESHRDRPEAAHGVGRTAVFDPHPAPLPVAWVASA